MLAISSVLGNRQSLDGGAMFGNVPRALWQRWCPPDEQGRIELSCRCFLVECDGLRLLVEAGVGAFFEPRLAKRYGVVEPEHRLLESLTELGVRPEEIDAVVLSHLHFDHAGGLLSAYQPDVDPKLVFPRARFFTGKRAYQRAVAPHPRDRASFVPELITLLDESSRLSLIDDDCPQDPVLGGRMQFFSSQGHTPGMLVPSFVGKQQTVTFCADLVPGVPWVHLPITMGYDRYPELLIDEKASLYSKAGVGSYLLFTHDHKTAAGRLISDESGRFFVQDERASLSRWDLDSDKAPH